MSSTTQHEVKGAEAILMDDLICQTFTQSSSTLAYACLLIRQKKYDLATHVLHSLEAKRASRFKDMVFYLQAQIALETGEYAVIKKRLIPRVNQHPNDMVALSLLESSIYLEWVDWQSRQPQVPSAPFPKSTLAPTFNQTVAYTSTPAVKPALIPSTPALPKVEGSEKNIDSGFGIYQALTDDANTLALGLGSLEPPRFKSTCRNSNLEPLIAMLPEVLPGSLAPACQALEGGVIQKICFSFQNLTVTSLHLDGEYLDLVTGNINKSLLTMVRAEKIFRKQPTSVPRPPTQPVEVRPNE